jgi:hypothetical protein
MLREMKYTAHRERYPKTQHEELRKKRTATTATDALPHSAATNNSCHCAEQIKTQPLCSTCHGKFKRTPSATNPSSNAVPFRPYACSSKALHLSHIPTTFSKMCDPALGHG